MLRFKNCILSLLIYAFTCYAVFGVLQNKQYEISSMYFSFWQFMVVAIIYFVSIKNDFDSSLQVYRFKTKKEYMKIKFYQFTIFNILISCSIFVINLVVLWISGNFKLNSMICLYPINEFIIFQIFYIFMQKNIFKSTVTYVEYCILGLFVAMFILSYTTENEFAFGVFYSYFRNTFDFTGVLLYLGWSFIGLAYIDMKGRVEL